MKFKPINIAVQQVFWRRIVLDTACVSISFVGVYALSSYFNFSDNYYVWARQYEHSIDIDELMPALLASLLALLWFAKRRIIESRFLIQKNHALLQRVLEVQEDERKRIARDLHDDLGQYLSAINAQASSLILDANNSADAQLTAKSITSSASYAYRATHNLIRSLRPTALDDLGLSAALEHLIDSWRTISADTNNNSHEPADNQTNYQLLILDKIDSFEERINIMIFRIVQEALTNISKHANAKHVFVSISNQSGYLILEIQDDGVGFDTNKIHAGYGLLGITERVEALGGCLEIRSQPNINQQISSTKIKVQIKV